MRSELFIWIKWTVDTDFRDTEHSLSASLEMSIELFLSQLKRYVDRAHLKRFIRDEDKVLNTPKVLQ